MKNLETRIKNIRFWKMWLTFTGVYVAAVYLPFMLQEVFPGLRDILVNRILNLPEGLMVITILLINLCPQLSVLLLALGLSGLSSREIRCPRCRKRLTVKEMETMGDRFLCPYCLNSSFNDKANTFLE